MIIKTNLQLDPEKVTALIDKLEDDTDDKDLGYLYDFAVFWFHLQQCLTLPPAPDTLSGVIDQLEDEYKAKMLLFMLDIVNKIPIRDTFRRSDDEKRKSVIDSLGIV